MMPSVGLPGGGAVSRPFIFGIVLILLFLSARTVCCVCAASRPAAPTPLALRADARHARVQDLENPERKLESSAERGSAKQSAQAKEHDVVSEKARHPSPSAAHARAQLTLLACGADHA
jgi:hypothetical protein